MCVCVCVCTELTIRLEEERVCIKRIFFRTRKRFTFGTSEISNYSRSRSIERAKVSINRRFVRSRIITREKNHRRAISSRRARNFRRAHVVASPLESHPPGRFGSSGRNEKSFCQSLSDKRRTSLLIESLSVDLSPRRSD